MSAKAKARHLVEILNFKSDMVERIIDSANMIYGPDENLDEESRENKRLVVTTVEGVCNDTVDAIIDQVIDAYASHYTEDELQSLVDWYTSPLGLKVLAEGKTLTVEIGSVMEKWGNDIWNVVKLRLGWTKES